MSFLRGVHLKARLTQPADEWWDRRLGVRTFGHHPATGGPDEREWFVHYIPSTYRDVFRALALADLRPDDIVTDLGSGLGRVAFAAAWAGARRVEGVERVEWLSAAAHRNHRASRLRSADIRFSLQDARCHDFSATTLLYMFHPFGPDVLGEVLEKISTDRRCARTPTPLRIVYVNPVGDDVIARSGRFRQIATAPARSQAFSSADHYPTSVWISA